MAALAAYRGLTTAALPVISALLAHRAGRGKEDPARLGERRGEASAPRPPGPLAWIHAASVGEAQSILALADRLAALRPDLGLLVTTGTVASAQHLAGRLPARAAHQYIPVDRAAWVHRFLGHWRPDLALWVESELWPNLLTATRARGIPMALINGRLSARSHANWRRLGGVPTRLLGCFDLVLAQDAANAERFRSLGAGSVAVTGSLKYDDAPLAADTAVLDALSRQIGDRPRWLAASTHAGEETVAGRVHRAIAPHQPGLLTIVVPRHPPRGDAIAAALRAAGLTVAQRSRGAAVAEATDVYLADTLGELGLCYRLAPVVFVGKSLGNNDGGHNPLEPARLDCAILFGPNMTNFREIAADLTAGGGAQVVDDEAALVTAVTGLLADHERCQRMAAAAVGLAAAKAGVLDRVVDALQPCLDRLPPQCRADTPHHARA